MAYGTQAAYAVVEVPLTAATPGVGTPIRKCDGASVVSVAIISQPSGSVASIRLGQGDEIPLSDRLGPLAIDPPHNGGISYIVPSIQAGSIFLLVGFWQQCPPFNG